MILDLVALRTLLAAVDLKGFGRAAERVNRSPGAVSLQIKALEERLDLKLFRKVGRQQVLTDEGEVLVGYARRLLALNDEAMVALHQLNPCCEILFGMPQDVADSLLPTTLERFRVAHPSTKVRVNVDLNDRVLDELESGQLDLGLVFRPADDRDPCAIATLPMRWYAAPGFRPDPAAPLPLLVSDAPCLFRQTAMEALDAAGRAWRPAMSTTSLSALWAAARAGLGVLPRVALHSPTGLQAVDDEVGLPPLPEISLCLLKDAFRVRPTVARLAAISKEVAAESCLI
ncbi:LysR substrate-binding domain-containing protein [Mitsuaria sp. 7]|uniref:LysR substrate-binding domain-containing protein n=1 Tax=Mitsuaria sp. 7 TaxID=1658665 RepID=UPI0007DCC54A|nr:LysR substrate-binding domain-containing protein [Mitsuaria sp. 7]ANH67766.1 hypothetical protein ABE85_09585 [Mitsuaria sp. 7]